MGNLFTELGSQVSVPSHQITNAGLQKPFIAYELCSIKDRLDFHLALDHGTHFYMMPTY